MPAQIRSKIPDIYSQEENSDPTVYLKFFSPYSGAVWLITEYDGRDQMFGWADLGFGQGELGYISLSELENSHRKGLPLVERDLYFKPVPLSRAKAQSRRAAYGRFTTPRSSYIPKDEPTLDRVKTPEGLEIWTWERELPASGKTGYFAIAFAGKAQKPLWHYWYPDASKRQRQIDSTVDLYNQRVEEKRKKLEERRNFMHDMKEGDILVSSWGYDQTNVDFYQVVGVSGKTVLIREISKKVVREERGADYVAPIPNKFIGAVLKKQPRQGGSVRLNSFSNAYKWDGKPKYQTAAGWGH